MIHLNNLYLRRGERVILDGVTIDINPGEHWVILGKNGSGKTTLLEMITGYMFPSSGTVDVLGNRFGQCDVREIRKEIGYISQSLLEKLTLADTVWEVVATGAFAFLRFYQEIPQEVKVQAQQQLEGMGLGHLMHQPLGSLSQGERKKVLLARSLMANPKLLIMDEPCAGLDLYEREKFLKELNRLSQQNMTAIYVTHHIEEITPLFTHVALIHEGKVAAAGPKHEVVTSELLSHAYDLPIEVEWGHERPWIRVRSQGDNL
ncbi:ABC transporter ATP-binding protein [Paenibacillus pinihumi]|uniref:ABC transporter ATP-binding protein n=1 Tax=Paenibacillus pinihumi TaxID=669462 RepID=UPI00048AB988|nr:ATP-binding cassette domain-containing protein [Paenibacillus pinihumi]